MSSTCGIPIPVPHSNNSTVELASGSTTSTLSSSHKRIGSCSQSSLYVPEAKRQQLSPAGDWPSSNSNGNFTPSSATQQQQQEQQEESNEDVNIANTEGYIDELLEIMGDEPCGDEGDSFESERMELLGAITANPVSPIIFSMLVDESPLPDENPHFSKALKPLPANEPTLVEDIRDLSEVDAAMELLRSLPTCIDEMVMAKGASSLIADIPSIESPNKECYENFLTTATDDLESRPLDDEDLEVAMINESFEEQQKKSHAAFECEALETFFLAEANSLTNADGNADTLSETVSTVSSNETSDDDNDEEAEEEEGEEEDADREDGCYSSLKSNEFIPVLTPKSKQFVKCSFAEKGRLASAADGQHRAYIVYPTSKRLFGRDGEEDQEHSRRLNRELENMMLEGLPTYWPDEEVGGARIDANYSARAMANSVDWKMAARPHPGTNEEESSTTILDECADAAEAIAHGVIASLFSSPVICIERSGGVATDEQASNPPPTEDYGPSSLFCENEHDSEFDAAKLLSESLLRDLETCGSEVEEEEEKEDPLLKASKRAPVTPVSLYTGNKAAASTSSTNSFSSAISSLEDTKEGREHDEQTVPVAASYQQLTEAHGAEDGFELG